MKYAGLRVVADARISFGSGLPSGAARGEPGAPALRFRKHTKRSDLGASLSASLPVNPRLMGPPKPYKRSPMVIHADGTRTGRGCRSAEIQANKRSGKPLSPEALEWLGQFKLELLLKKRERRDEKRKELAERKRKAEWDLHQQAVILIFKSRRAIKEIDIG